NRGVLAHQFSVDIQSGPAGHRIEYRSQVHVRLAAKVARAIDVLLASLPTGHASGDGNSAILRLEENAISARAPGRKTKRPQEAIVRQGGWERRPHVNRDRRVIADDSLGELHEVRIAGRENELAWQGGKIAAAHHAIPSGAAD